MKILLSLLIWNVVLSAGTSLGRDFGNPTVKIEKVLCEVFLSNDAVSTALSRQLYDNRQNQQKLFFPIIFHFSIGHSKLYFQTRKTSHKLLQIPSLVLNGHLKTYPSQTFDWKEFSKYALRELDKEQQWPLSVYLSVKMSRSGTPEIIVNICNLDTKARFLGKYEIILLESRTSPDLFSGIWIAKKEITHQTIDLLPKKWCPLPKPHVLSMRVINKRHSLLVIVSDSDGKVHKTALEDFSHMIAAKRNQ